MHKHEKKRHVTQTHASKK